MAEKVASLYADIGVDINSAKANLLSVKSALASLKGEFDNTKLIAKLIAEDQMSRQIDAAKAKVAGMSEAEKVAALAAAQYKEANEKAATGIDKLGAAADKNIASVNGLGDSFQSLTGVSLSFAGVAASIGAVLKFSVSEAMDAERAMAATAAVIKSTGAAAGISAQQIADLSNAEMGITGIADEVIQSGQNMLLTFRSIGADVFPRATRAMEDMAVAMAQGNIANIDMKGTAIQLGKALEDPINGVTALRRVGVMLTDSQERQIKSFMAVNDVAAAQAIILKELEAEFGGMAEAIGSTSAGKIQKAKNAIGELGETIGSGLLPILGDAASRIEDNFKVITILAQNFRTGKISADEYGAALAELWKVGMVGAATGQNLSNLLKRLNASLEDNSEAAIKATTSYEDYIAQEQKAYAAKGQLIDATGRLIEEVYEENNGWVKLQGAQVAATREDWNAVKSKEALSSAMRDSSAAGMLSLGAIKNLTTAQADYQGSLAITIEAEKAHQAILDAAKDVYGKAVIGALDLSSADKRLAEEERKLADLNAQYLKAGPQRKVIDAATIPTALELAAAQAKVASSQQQIIAVQEALSKATKNKGETDAEYNARLAEMHQKLADLRAGIENTTTSMQGHTKQIGMDTDAYNKQRESIEANIKAMKDQSRQAVGLEMIKALDPKNFRSIEEYNQIVKQINDTYGLFTDAELKAATSHTVLIGALTEAKGLPEAQKAIIDYYTGIGDAYDALTAKIAAGIPVSGDYAGGHAEKVKATKPVPKELPEQPALDAYYERLQSVDSLEMLVGKFPDMSKQPVPATKPVDIFKGKLEDTIDVQDTIGKFPTTSSPIAATGPLGAYMAILQQAIDLQKQIGQAGGGGGGAPGASEPTAPAPGAALPPQPVTPPPAEPPAPKEPVTPPKRKEGRQSGMDYTVPPGYEGDNYPIGYAQSGERVIVVPRGQVAKSKVDYPHFSRGADFIMPKSGTDRAAKPITPNAPGVPTLPNLPHSKMNVDFIAPKLPRMKAGADFIMPMLPRLKVGADFTLPDAPRMKSKMDFAAPDLPRLQVGGDFKPPKIQNMNIKAGFTLPKLPHLRAGADYIMPSAPVGNRITHNAEYTQSKQEIVNHNNTRGGDSFTFNVNDSKAAAMFAQLIRQQRAEAASARMG